jgi:hypothetical protein
MMGLSTIQEAACQNQVLPPNLSLNRTVSGGRPSAPVGTAG